MAQSTSLAIKGLATLLSLAYATRLSESDGARVLALWYHQHEIIPLIRQVLQQTMPSVPIDRETRLAFSQAVYGYGQLVVSLGREDVWEDGDAWVLEVVYACRIFSQLLSNTKESDKVALEMAFQDLLDCLESHAHSINPVHLSFLNISDTSDDVSICISRLKDYGKSPDK